MIKTSTLFHTTILVLILAPGLFANAHYVLAQANGTGTTDGHAGVEPGQASDLVLDLGSQDATETTGYLSLPDNATVVGASVTVIPGPGTVSTAGKDHGEPVHPDGPRVDVGADGTADWAFDGVGYGEAGHQTKFGNGAGGVAFGTSKDHSWTITDNDDTHANASIIRLPKNARVSSARLLLEPFLRKDWLNASWQRRVPIEVKALGDGLLPVRVEREVQLEATHRDPVPELRLTALENGAERPVPFWVVSATQSRVTIGFDVPWTEAGATRMYNLYYDDPFGPGSVAIPYVPAVIDTMFINDTVPPVLGPRTGPLALHYPMGLFQASNGSLLVVDSGDQRVLMLDTTGRTQMTLGTPGVAGSDNIHFTYPNDVIVDATGRIIVADAWLHRVQVFGPDGAYQRTIGVTGKPGSDGTHLFDPWALALDEYGHLYVSDTGNERVQVFDSIGATTARWTYGVTDEYGRDSSHLDSPRGIACADGLYIADAYNARVQRFQTLGDRWADLTLGMDRLVTPTDVAIGNGKIYIADVDQGKVLELDRMGYFVREITGLSWPSGVAVGPKRDLWISDTGANRVLRVVNATFTVHGSESLMAPKDIKLNVDGRPLAGHDGPLIGKEELSGLGATIMEALNHSRCSKDPYQNELCGLRLTVKGPDPGPGSGLTINGLDIRYSFSTRMSVSLAPGTMVVDGGTSYLPVTASSRNGGRIVLEGFTPELDYPPFPSLPRWVPGVPEGTNGSVVLDLDEAFRDEGPMTFDAQVVDGPEGMRTWVGTNNTLMVDLSASPNSTVAMRLRLRATDVLGQTTEAVLDVPVDNVPQPPFVPLGQAFRTICGAPFTATITAEDGDNDTLLFYLLDGPDGFGMGPYGDLDWTPGPRQAGTNVVHFDVSDGLFDVESDVTIIVDCIRHPPQVNIAGNLTVQVGDMLSVPVGLESQDGKALSVQLRMGPVGMRYDPSLGAILWRPSLEDAGDVLVILSVSDGTLSTVRTMHIDVQRPRPWVRLSRGPDKIADWGLRFTGVAGGTGGRVWWVQARVDDGPWANTTGAPDWSAEVDAQALAPGHHSLEVRSFDGRYSDVLRTAFTVLPDGKGADGTAGPWQAPATSLIVILVVILIIGGIVMLKTYNGFVFCVQKSPEGPMTCVPLGERTEAVGGRCVAEEEPDEVPDQPPRNIRCIVCLGRMKSAGDYLECARCGRFFHKACASRIKACPMCGADLVKDEA
jgi:sugar lactone lactonase YvrE